jgi:hypothetical protein
MGKINLATSPYALSSNEFVYTHIFLGSGWCHNNYCRWLETVAQGLLHINHFPLLSFCTIEHFRSES